MQAPDNAPEQQISLLELFILYSNARDVYQFSIASGADENLTKDIIQLKNEMRLLAVIIINTVCNYLQRLCTETAKKLQEQNIGDALVLIKPVLDDIRTFQSRLIERVDQRDFLVDTIQGMQLFSINWLGNIAKFLSHINTARTQRKYDEEHAKKIDAILLELKSDCSLTTLKLDGRALNNIHTNIEDINNKLIKNYKLEPLYQLFCAFNECLNVNKKLVNSQLSKEEVEHLGYLIREYYMSEKDKGECNPVIIEAIYLFEHFKTIFDVELVDMHNFLDLLNVESKSYYITRRFKNASSQVFRTYEALALATAAYEEINLILEAIIELKIKRIKANYINRGANKNLMPKEQRIENNKEIIQVRKYQDCFRNAFQLSMRLRMPIEEIIHNYKKLQVLLEKLQNNDSKSLLECIATSYNRLTSCSDLLQQKILGVNAYKDLINYIKQLGKFLNKNEDITLNTFFHSSKNYKPLMQNLKAYFIQISASRRTEAHSNFQAIFDKIKSLFLNDKVDFRQLLDNKARANDEEKLLIDIYQRFETNAKKYQEDVQSSSIEFPKSEIRKINASIK